METYKKLLAQGSGEEPPTTLNTEQIRRVYSMVVQDAGEVLLDIIWGDEDAADKIKAIQTAGKFSGLERTDVTSGDAPMKILHVPDSEY